MENERKPNRSCQGSAWAPFKIPVEEQKIDSKRDIGLPTRRALVTRGIPFQRSPSKGQETADSFVGLRCLRDPATRTEADQLAKDMETVFHLEPRRERFRRRRRHDCLNEKTTFCEVAAHLKKKALPLCLPDNLQWNPQTGEIVKLKDTRSSLYVVEAAIYELRKLKEPVCVVSIVGPCRDGKSFILSEAFGQPDVFPVGHKMDPETMGIWIWILPNMIKDNSGRELRVVLLDSEGIDAAGADGKNDNQIFSLTVLMASILIYNSKNVPKRSDLDNLDFVARLSQQIEAISFNRTRGIKNEDALDKTFPHFIWLLRDVMTEIPDDCRDIKDFFLKRIFKGPDSSKEDRTQQIAESILNFFAGFDAFCLPPPAYKKELMKNIQRNRHGMNREFFDEVEKFKQVLKSRLCPKKSCNEGEFVTGEGLAALTKLYVSAINDPSSVPNVQTAWETFVQRKCQEAKEKALLAYDKKMKAELSKLPCESEKILASHESATAVSMEIFHSETVGITSENTRMDSEQLMNEEMKKWSEWKTKNDRLTKVRCEQLLDELKQECLDPILEVLSGPNRQRWKTVSYKKIEDACSYIENVYRRNSEGASKVRAEVFHEFHKRLMAEKEMLRKLRDYNEDLFQQRLENAKKDKEAKKLRENNQYMKKQQEIQEKELRDSEERKRQDLLTKLNQAQATESSLKKKIQDMEAAGMKTQISNLNNELSKVKNEKWQW